MFNEAFDDDVADDVEDVPVAEEPKGDFSRVLAGRTVWFKSPLPGQFHAWKRYRQGLVRKFNVVQVQATKNPSLDSLRELSKIHEKFELSTIELVEGMLVNPDDADFISMEMISGRITSTDIQDVLFRDETPDDDQEPIQAPKKAKKVPAAKAAANAKRTRK